MERTRITYEILANGYIIKLDNKAWIEQVGKNSKPMDSAKTFEENCLLQIEEITKEVEKEIDQTTELLEKIEELKAKATVNSKQIDQTALALTDVYEMLLG